MRRMGLQTKAVVGLLTIAAVPLLVSWIIVGQLAVQLGDAASAIAEGKGARLVAPLTRAADAYREAVEARRAEFKKGAAVLAVDKRLARACVDRLPAGDVARLLADLVRADPKLAHVSFIETGRFVAAAERTPREPVRDLTVTEPLVEAPWCSVRLSYVIGEHFLEDHKALGQVLGDHRKLEAIRLEVPRSYRWKFLVLVGSVVMLVTIVAIFVARRTTRRIDRLVEATQRVGEGDLDSRVALGGRDELADLAHAFDRMTVDLKRSRAEIEYLQKIGAWQEVARRLAHEIKNPLTPIQLAVQQLHTKYDGADPRFKKMLDDAHAIVTEEVAGLRRLVDAFSGFAKLPRVEPSPLDLAAVVEDAQRESAFDAEAPPGPITVEGDRLLLRRALLNLVENARQAGAGRVVVAWRRRGDGALLTVDDDGPGVPEAIRGRVFDPYVTSKEHGTGLGLAIVKKTVLEHGGDVTLAEAPSPLGGARFEIVLPVAGVA